MCIRDSQLTERNLEMWREFQHNLIGAMGRPTAAKPKDKAATGGKHDD